MGNDNLTDTEITTIFVLSIIIATVCNIYYLLTLIIFCKQGCKISIKKGITILLSITPLISNIFYYFPNYELIKLRNTEPNISAPTFCIIKTSLRNSFNLLSFCNFSFIFLYSYLVLEHIDFLIKHEIKITVGYLGTLWTGGIILAIILSLDKTKKISNIGDCETSSYLYFILFLLYMSLAIIMIIFCVIKIFLNLRRQTADDENRKKFKQKLFILGIILASSVIVGGLFFFLMNKSYIVCIRICVNILSSFIFVFFYTYDQDTKDTLKEIFCCKEKKQEEPLQPVDFDRPSIEL